MNGTQVTGRWIRAMLEDANADPFASRPTLPPRIESLRLSVITHIILLSLLSSLPVTYKFYQTFQSLGQLCI